MRNAILSRVDLDDLLNDNSALYNECVGDLADLPDILKLDDFSQHMNTSRLQHSVNVSYYSFLICKALGWDHRAAARAGLLHDFFLYDWRSEKQPEGHHAKAHPKVALNNARKLVGLSSVEEDAIVKHMWPVTMPFPKYKESYVVSFIDKYCACCEILNYCGVKVKFGISLFRWLLNGSVYAR